MSQSQIHSADTFPDLSDSVSDVDAEDMAKILKVRNSNWMFEEPLFLKFGFFILSISFLVCVG